MCNWQQIFEGDTCVASFMQYLIQIKKIFKKVIIIAHNMQGYDGHFCLRYMYNSKKWELGADALVMNGTKILKISVDRYLFIDSLNYFMVPLSKLSSMFKLDPVKGYYPHFFNTKENYQYIGSIPNKTFYNPDAMNTSDREIFMSGYDEQVKTQGIFNNRSELIKYCVLDVEILRLACIQFQNILIEKTGVDPFDGPITKASTCLTVFRTDHLSDNTIGIIPSGGYRRADNQSLKAIQWLTWIAHKKNVNIQTAENGQEFVLDINIKVDGFDAQNQTVYEFLGCFWHRCIKCYPIQNHILPNNTDSNFGLKRDSDNLRFRETYKYRNGEFHQQLKFS